MSDTVVVGRMSRVFDDEVRDLGLVVAGEEVLICHYDAVLQRFLVAWRRGGVWAREALDGGARVGASCDVARVGDGFVVAWQGAGGLRVARWVDGSWQPEAVADAGGRSVDRGGGAGVAVAHRGWMACG
ncbi:MAG: hypothetical protein R3F65_08170 [bacterium]